MRIYICDNGYHMVLQNLSSFYEIIVSSKHIYLSCKHMLEECPMHLDALGLI